MQEKEIRAVYDKSVIRVYQAYPKEIADEAIKSGTFGKRFKVDRTTWIKPSFLWMMYRSGWATKENQEKVLGIDIRREAFEYIVKSAVPSKYPSETYKNYYAWKRALSESDVICQWDPERNILGEPLGHRTIQLGLRRQAVMDYISKWIVTIEDITDYVAELNRKRLNNIDITNELPKEEKYFFLTK